MHFMEAQTLHATARYAAPGRRRRTPPHAGLALNVLKQFRLIYGSARQQFREVEANCAVSGSQLWTLHEIQAAPGIGITELAQRLSIHQTTCSQLAEKLVVRGYIVKARSTTDQRRVGLTVTRAAAQVLARAPGPAEGILPEALAALPRKTLSELHLRLDALIARLQVTDERAAGRPLSDF